jgi:hypothetical protein
MGQMRMPTEMKSENLKGTHHFGYLGTDNIKMELEEVACVD